MLFLVLIAANIISVFSDSRNFYPQTFADDDDDSFYNGNRVWMHLGDDDGCYSDEDDVRSFKDYLLFQYNCISFDDDRKEIYKHPTSPDISVWSLWLEISDDDIIIDFQCLNRTIDLPQGLPSSCIDGVYYEPIHFTNNNNDDDDDDDDDDEYQCMVQDIEETNQELGVNLWSLDILDSTDGSFDKKYRYPLCGDDNDGNDDKNRYKNDGNDNNNDNNDNTDDDDDGYCKVEAIVLDTNVDAEHTEFSEADPKSLFEGRVWDPQVPDKEPEKDHGTHTSATVVGKNVGGAKKTKLRYYPLCKLWSSYWNDWVCGWSDIEAGYETAIKYMNDGDKGTRYVINYSVGGGRNEKKEEAYNSWGKRINEAGGIWVTSAGNKNKDACTQAPAFTSEAITVAAYGYTLKAAYYTNYGECVDVWGPGGDYQVGPTVWSAKDGGGYREMQGTSMASPNIASIVANLLKMNNKLKLEDIKEYMKEKARYVEDDTKGTMNQAYLICTDDDDSNSADSSDSDGSNNDSGDDSNNDGHSNDSDDDNDDKDETGGDDDDDDDGDDDDDKDESGGDDKSESSLADNISDNNDLIGNSDKIDHHIMISLSPSALGNLWAIVIGILFVNIILYCCCFNRAKNTGNINTSTVDNQENV